MDRSTIVRWLLLPLWVLDLVFLAGCESTRPLYYWGDYESAVHGGLTRPGEFPPERVLDLLDQDLHRAESAGALLPPGFWAYRGMLLLESGDIDAAIAAFETEGVLYPESRGFMDFLISTVTTGTES
ncbi:MAG: hypothetical protein BWY82_01557 [Verrucomicrobia bacterium ADurb.Bin474]|nr:MAG: hypothetical protein BWY82_01557 [Verrucomicrobia bacterium ADurb.Bin474]